MIKSKLEIYIVTFIAIVAIAVLLAWLLYNPVANFHINNPGLDNRIASDSNAIDKIVIGDKFKEYSTTTTTLTGKWPRFRGADFDNINKENIKLIDKWPKTGPNILWKVDLGEGHAAPAIYNGKVYLLDYDERKKMDALRCFTLETGIELWRRSYNVNVKRNHGMSRTIPAVTDKFVVTIGPRCHVMCSNTNNGDLLWGIDLVKDFKTDVPLWYTGQCPLIDNDTAIIAPGGTSLMMGVDCTTGKVAWQTPNPDNWKMSHSSIMPMTFEGKKMYVYCAIGGMCGISAQGADKGKILWKTSEFKPSVIAPSPLILNDGKIFMTAGYGAGAFLIQLKKDNETFSVKILEHYKPSIGIASEQQTAVVFSKHIFIIQPKDGGATRNQFVCCKPQNIKNILWTSSKSERFGLGPYILADGKFFILDDEGVLSIVKASTEKFILLDKAKIIEGNDAWGPIAIADGMLLMRDSKQMVCININAK